MFLNLVQKYGVVPKSVYPETYASSNSRRLGWLLNVKLREYAVQIRDAIQQGASVSSVRLSKERMLTEIYRILVICLGQPPHKFDWETTDKHGKYVGVKKLTPLKFFKEVVKHPVRKAYIISDQLADLVILMHVFKTHRLQKRCPFSTIPATSLKNCTLWTAWVTWLAVFLSAMSIQTLIP